MDLDKIKQEWQNSEDVKPNLTETVISKMLDNKGQYALNSIVKYERWSLIGLFFCIFASISMYKYHFLFYSYILLVIFSIPYQAYKYHFLKKCKENNDSILEFSKKIMKYKKIISWEFKLGIIYFIIFAGGYMYYTTARANNHIPILGMCVLWGTILFCAIMVYKSFYWQNIKMLQQSIKEIKDFEKEN